VAREGACVHAYVTSEQNCGRLSATLGWMRLSRSFKHSQCQTTSFDTTAFCAKWESKNQADSACQRIFYPTHPHARPAAIRSDGEENSCG